MSRACAGACSLLQQACIVPIQLAMQAWTDFLFQAVSALGEIMGILPISHASPRAIALTRAFNKEMNKLIN